MPNPIQLRMEHMSIAYVEALSAYHGYSVTKPPVDNEGVDLYISCKDRVVKDSLLLSVQLNVQMKSSFSSITYDSNGDVHYPLEVKNYNLLTETMLANPTILILFEMHDVESNWIEHNPDFLKITKCAYWASLKGQEKTENKGTKTIVIPKENILTPDALKSLMIKISKCEEL